MPLGPEADGTIAGAELPEGGVPGGAVAGLGGGTRGDQPAFEDFLKETGLEQTLTVLAAELVGLEDAAAVFLEMTKGGEGGGEELVGHKGGVGGYKFIVLCEYKFILLCEYKFILFYGCKSIVRGGGARALR